MRENAKGKPLIRTLTVSYTVCEGNSSNTMTNVLSWLMICFGRVYFCTEMKAMCGREPDYDSHSVSIHLTETLLWIGLNFVLVLLMVDI